MLHRFLRFYFRKFRFRIFRLDDAPKAAILLGSLALAGAAAEAAPKAAPAPQHSLAGKAPESAIAAPERDLVARSQPRVAKSGTATAPKMIEEKTTQEDVSVLTTASTLPRTPVQVAITIPLVNPTAPKPVMAKVTTVKPVDPKQAEKDAAAKQEKILLAQLEADLIKTEKRLDSTSEKLSAGQKELMSLSNTLRTVMLDEGEDASGLHPFVKVASRYMGTPYVWGGESRYGFDCSGFIIRVMRDLGYKALPHSAAEQFKYGQPVASSRLKPGDIVFFANTYKRGISHVGIYIGKGRFIHAASTRQGTIVSSLNASPYRQKYAGARRLIPAGKRA